MRSLNGQHWPHKPIRAQFRGNSKRARTGQPCWETWIIILYEPEHIAADIWTPGHRSTESAAIIPQPLRRRA